MALGPTLMLGPLYEIERTMQQMFDKYNDANAVTLQALKPSTNPPTGSGVAPSNAIRTYLSTVADQLYKFNVLKNTIESEKKTRKGLATALLVICLIMALVMAVLIIWLVIKPEFKAVKNSTTLKDYKIIVAVYHILLLVGGFISIFFIAITTYVKYANMYDMYYKTDGIFDDEAINDMLQMMRFHNYNRQTGSLVKMSGNNPILGYFVHVNQGVNVRYTFIPQESSNKNGLNQNQNTTPYLNTKKTFLFRINDRKHTLDDMTNINNWPNEFADRIPPFHKPGTRQILQHTGLFKKKLQKYDMYSQYSKISNAVSYFKNLLQINGGQNTSSDSLYNIRLTEAISSTIQSLSQFIIVRDIHPHKNFLASLDTTKKKTSITQYEFFKLFIDAPPPGSVCFAYYDAVTNNGYFLDENDCRQSVFVYSTITSSDANTSSVSMLKKTTNQTVLHLAISAQPMTQTFVNKFKNESLQGNEISHYSLYQTQINATNGTINTSSLPSTMQTLINKNSGPTTYYADILGTHPSRIDGPTPVEAVFVYRTIVNDIISQNAKPNLQNMYNSFREYLLEKCLQSYINIEPSGSVVFSRDMIEGIHEKLELSFGNLTYKLIRTFVTDLIAEVPVKMANYIQNEKELQGVDKSHAKYVSYEIFASTIRGMDQNYFMNVFMYNVEELRYTSAGLKKLYDKFNFGYDTHEKNQLMLEFVFYMLTIFGLMEGLRTAFNRTVGYHCDKFDIEAEIEQGTKEFNELPVKTDDVKRSHEKKVKALKSNIEQKKAWTVLVVCFICFSYLFVLSMLYAWKEHSRNVFSYNKFVLESNGNSIKINSEELFRDFEAKIKQNKLVSVYLTPPNTIASGDDDSLYFDLKNSAKTEDGKTVSVLQSEDFRPQYDKLISILDNFDKCNMLMDSRGQDLPFPLLETTMYFALIFIVVLLVVFISMVFKPYEHFIKYKNWRRIKQMLEKNIEVTSRSYGFDCHDDGVDKQVSYTAFLYVIAVITLIVGILFFTTIIQNSNQFTSALYASDLFKNFQCYS